MAAKKILFCIGASPRASMFCLEGLRATVGAASDLQEHMVAALMYGDGVYLALSNSKRDSLEKFLRALTNSDVRLYVDRASLEARRIPLDKIDSRMEPVSQEQILRMLQDADHCVNFSG